MEEGANIFVYTFGEELSKKGSLRVDEGIDLSWKKERKARRVLTCAVAWLVMGAKMGFKNKNTQNSTIL